VTSSATTDLASSFCLLEFMTKAPEFMGSDNLVGRGLVGTEYCSVFRDLDVDSDVSRPFLVEPGLINERSLRILFRSVTTLIERMSYEGFAKYSA